MLADFFRQLFTLLMLLVVLFVIDWKLSLVCFLTVPLIVVPVYFLGRRIRSISRQTQEQLGGLNETLQETFSGIRIVQAFGMEAAETARFFDKSGRLFRLNLRWVRHYAIASPMMEVLGAVTAGALLLYASSRIASGSLQPGNMIQFMVAFIKVYQPVKRLVSFHGLLQQALGCMVTQKYSDSQSLMRILLRSLPPEVDPQEGPLAINGSTREAGQGGARQVAGWPWRIDGNYGRSTSRG